MSQYGYGSGGYLTRFEDYYKSSSDDSDDEDDVKDRVTKQPIVETPFVSTFESPLGSYNPDEFYHESEDDGYSNIKEDVSLFQSYQAPEVDIKPSNNFQHDFTTEEFEEPSKDWVPSVLNDLKLTIKPPKDFKGYKEGAYPEDVEEQNDDDEDKTFSNDYADVCKFKCNLCGLDIDTEKLRSHINTNHENAEFQDNELDSNRPYSVKTHHKCGICGKTLLFTRVRLRYHIINDHNMAIQDYNEQYMAKRGARSRMRRGSGNNEEYGDNDVDPATVKEEEISDDYADIVKIDCKICNKHIEKDNFR